MKILAHEIEKEELTEISYSQNEKKNVKFDKNILHFVLLCTKSKDLLLYNYTFFEYGDKPELLQQVSN